MKTIIKNIVLTFFLFPLPVVLLSQTQPYFSESWNVHGGETAMFYKNATTTDDQGNVYIGGATINEYGNHDIFIQKLNRRGELIWDAKYNGVANMDDASADIFVDNQYNVYITGTTVENLANAQDLIVLKYNETGVLEWKFIYNNNNVQYGSDVGTAIIGDNNGNIYVTGSSFGNNTQADYVTLCLNSNNGNEKWKQRYDYNGLNEIPAKIVVQGNNLYVSGASQVTSNKWELATLSYRTTDGTLLGVVRSGGNATQGVNKINDITLDNEGNIYLTGSVNNANSSDIAVYKLDDELNILWEEHFDAYGEDDKGSGIKVDSSGNVYVAGTISTQNEGKNYMLLKYNSSGALQWRKAFNGLENEDDEAVQLTLYDDYIYVTGLAKNSSRYSFQTLVYKSNGELYTQAEFTNLFENEKPTGITTDINGDVVIVGQTELTNGRYRARTIKYSLYEKPLDPVFENGEPKYNANEVIIRFDRSAVNYSVIDRKGFIAGQLQDFVKSNVIAEMNGKLEFDVGRLPTYKIFRRMTTADSLSITRLGDTIKVDDFWATLSVMFPVHVDMQGVIDSLNSISSIIHYSEPNYIGKIFSIPNDDLYPIEQSGLYDPTHGINVENAWNKQVGQDYIKIGVYDSGINWRHEDFGDGSWAGSKIEGGWDYYNNADPSSQTYPDSDGHGTAVAGIIGALRNNNKGIAGIAGGNYQQGNYGSKLYTMGIPVYVPLSPQDVVNILHTSATEAIVEGATFNPNTNFGFGLHVQNHSWGSPFTSNTLYNSIKTSFKNKSVVVVSSGNDGLSSTPTIKNYPASYSDELVLKVGANDISGDRAGFSTYDNHIDFIAPGTNDIYSTLDHNNNEGYNYSGYGTSFAAPHVTGVVSLLLSQHNIINGYPNDLAPEDVEIILEKYATSIGYPNETGSGRINADLSIRRLTLPDYYIKHSGGSNNTTQIPALNQTVILQNSVNNIAAGQYFADRYQVTNTFLDVLPPNHEIIDNWKRYSSTTGVSAANPITGEPYYDYTYTINQNVISVTTTTFCWWIKTNVIGQTINKWLPASPNELKTTYSLHVKDNTPLGIEQQEQNDYFKIYPNPTNSTVNIDFTIENITDEELQITDAMGRIIMNFPLKQMNSGNHSTTVNLSNLANGMYIFTLKMADKVISKRVIKE